MPKRARGVAPEPEGDGGVVAEAPDTGSERPTRGRGRPPTAADPTPGVGFQGWSEADESQLEAQGPEAPDPEARAIEVRVVFLGTKKYHSIPRPGALVWHTREDGSTFAVPAPPETEGIIPYNFDGVDSQGKSSGTLKRTHADGTVVQLPRVRRTERDNRPFAICRHIEHAAWFLNQRDKEGNPQYWLRAPDTVIQKIKDYEERRKRAVREDPNSNRNVLRQIQPPTWRDLGGPIGERLA